MRYLFWLFLSAIIAASPAQAGSPAQAEWRQARTDHFVLTINDTEEGARDFATRLERFDIAMRQLYAVPDDPDRHVRPIAIFAFDQDLFYSICGCPGVLGFYSERAAGSQIFSVHMPGIDRKTKIGWWSSQTLLLHEYSHHFAYSNFPIAYPYWFSEGFAEFNANASFEADGAIVIGYPANYRAESLKMGGRVSPKKLFDPQKYGFVDDIGLLYGRGWLLTHYLMLNPRRRPQLGAYLAAMNKGKQSLEAAQEAFGDLSKLNDELEIYRKGRFATIRVAPPPGAPKVVVTTMPEGQAAMLPVHTIVTRGIRKGYRMGVAQRAAKIARRYPDDAIVQAQWAEAEFHAGRLANADKAADAALKLKPNLVDALVMKGQVAIQRAREATAPEPAQWASARSWFLKANRADPNAVMPLYLYYSSFVAAKAEPSASAVKGLMRAQVLAPESTEVRLALARHMLLDGDSASARFLLQPIAFAPHRPRDKNIPREIVDLIDAGKIAEAKAAMTKATEEEEED